MKYILRTSAILIMASFLTACGGPELNGKTQETLQTSMKEVIDSLDKKESRQFQEDFSFISMSMMKNVKFDMNALKAKQNEMLDTFDGKTAEDVADLANELREQDREKQVAEEEFRKNRGPVVNGKSMLTFESSMRVIGESLSKDQRAELVSDIEVIGQEIRDQYKGSMFEQEDVKREFLKKVNDKSFSEISAIADEIREK